MPASSRVEADVIVAGKDFIVLRVSHFWPGVLRRAVSIDGSPSLTIINEDKKSSEGVGDGGELGRGPKRRREVGWKRRRITTKKRRYRDEDGDAFVSRARNRHSYL